MSKRTIPPITVVMVWKKDAKSVRAALTLAAWITGLLSLAYLLEPTSFDPVFRDKYLAHLRLVLLHGVSGVLALCLGPLLLFPDPLGLGWGKLSSVAHRLLGRLYVGAVLVGAVTGRELAEMAFGGGVARAGFLLLALLWLFTVWRAFILARAGLVLAHRRWMARNYALTFSAVTLRALLHLGQMAGLSFAVLYPWAAWSCWVPNLMLAEIVVRRLSFQPGDNPQAIFEGQELGDVAEDGLGD